MLLENDLFSDIFVWEIFIALFFREIPLFQKVSIWLCFPVIQRSSLPIFREKAEWSEVLGKLNFTSVQLISVQPSGCLVTCITKVSGVFRISCEDSNIYVQTTLTKTIALLPFQVALLKAWASNNKPKCVIFITCCKDWSWVKNTGLKFTRFAKSSDRFWSIRPFAPKARQGDIDDIKVLLLLFCYLIF